MTLQIAIANFKGVKNANIETAQGPTLIAGINGAGKTSIAQCISTMIQGELPGKIKSSDQKKVVHNGEKNCLATIKNGECTHSICLPKMELQTTGIPLKGSPEALGVVSILDMKPSQRMEYFTNLLNATPTKDNLDKAIPYGKAIIDKLWLNIEGLGWKATHANAKEKGSLMKGEWKGVTGEQWGSSKAENWIPPHWTPDLLNKSTEDLQKDYESAKQWYESAVAQNAIDATKATELESVAALEEEWKTSLAKTIAQYEITEKKLKVVKSAVELHAVKLNRMFCPKCKGVLILKDGKLQAPLDFDQEAQEKDQAELAELSPKFKELREARNHQAKMHAESINAREELAKYKNKDSKDIMNTEKAQEKMDQARAILTSHSNKKRADQIHGNIGKNAVIVKQLSESGIRADVLTKALGKTNIRLAEICLAMSFGTISITEKFDLEFNGVPADFYASMSERWRINAVLQLYIAELDKSDVILLDYADILYKASRNGLFRYLKSLAAEVFVFMTLDDESVMPDLSKIGGKSYWIENGVLK